MGYKWFRTGRQALQVEPPVLAPMPPFMVEKVGFPNGKMSYHCRVLKGGCSRGGGNWGTLRIPGKIGEP